jgi:hypothetical protein
VDAFADGVATGQKIATAASSAATCKLFGMKMFEFRIMVFP